MDKKGKRLTVLTPWAKIVDPLAIVIEGKVFGEDKEENKYLLPIVWFLALESKTQGLIEEDWVRPTKDIPVRTTEVVELEVLRSSHHLRKSLKRANLSTGADEGDPQQMIVREDQFEQQQQIEEDKL